MEMSGSCRACGEQRMVLDAIHGVLACDVCGVVGNQAETELRSEWQTGHVIERRGTYVGQSDTGAGAARGLMRGQVSHSFYSSCPQNGERHRLETMKKVETITALLRVPGDKVDQAKHLLDSTLNGDWGMGRWVDILVAACVYIVIRQSQLPLTVPEVADCVNCDVIELGRMYNRVLQKLEISLPNVDPFVFLERAASTFPALTKLDKELVRKMKKQGTVLLDYTKECFIATGRRPLPIVAAVLFLVLKANKVLIKIAEVATELHAGLWATKKRYRECQVALVGIGQSLPWGTDITLKTVPRHLPFLLQYLEVKTRLEKKKKGQTRTDNARSSDHQHPSVVLQTSGAHCATDATHVRESTAHTSAPETQPCSSKRSFECVFGRRPACEISRGNGDRLKEPASSSQTEDLQSHVASDASFAPLSYQRPAKSLKLSSLPDHSSRRNDDNSVGVNFSGIEDINETVEDSCETAQPNTETEDGAAQTACVSGKNPKDHQWEGLPAAFCASQEGRTRRRVKIDLAKERISEARKALSNRFAKGSVDSSVPEQNVQNKVKPMVELTSKSNLSLDWEDLLIEHLVLSGASEAELENGYYRSLLAVYPEQRDTELVDDDPASYLRSRTEVELLLELTAGREEGGIITQCPSPLAELPPP